MCNETSGTCQGLAEGEFCAKTIECAKNFYCDNTGKCAAAKTVGTACVNDDDCEIGSICEAGSNTCQ